MAKEDKVKTGDPVFDVVHGRPGTVVQVVPQPEDGHHQTYLVVESDVEGVDKKVRKVRSHLVAGQYRVD